MSERIGKNLTRIALALLVSSPITADATIKAANMLNDLSPQITELSRRDILKILALGSGVATSLNAPGIISDVLRKPDGEKISEFAGNAIAEAGTGTVSKLQLTRSDLLDQIVLRRIAQQNITPARGKVITTQLYSMVGTENDADFVIASEIDHTTQIPTGRSWVGFGVKEVDVDSSNQKIAALKPPTIYDQMTFIEMDVVNAGDGKIALGAVSELGGISPLFVFDVSTDGNGNTTFDNPKFLPPFADQFNSGPVDAPRSLTRHARIKKSEAAESPKPALPAEIEGLQKSLEGTNYAFAWNNDLKSIALTYTNPETGETSVIPEIVFDEKGNWKRTYTFETPYGTQAEVTIDSRVDNRDTKIKVVETPEGKKILDFSAWRLVDGKWEEEIISGEKTYNVSEAQFILQDNGSKDSKDGYDKEKVSSDEANRLMYEYLDKMFPGISHVNGIVKINKFNAVIDTGRNRWTGSSIKTLDNNGNPIIINTTDYVVHNLMPSGNAILIYRDVNRDFRCLIIDADLNDLRNWSPYFTKAWFN